VNVIDSPPGRIEVNSGTQNWGPFAFDAADSVPPGDTLASVEVASALIPSGTDSTAALIVSGSEFISGNTVQIRLKYPGAAFIGSHEITFTLVFASGAQMDKTFGYVIVRE